MVDEAMIHYSTHFKTRDDLIMVVKTLIFSAKNLMPKFFPAYKSPPLKIAYKWEVQLITKNCALV